MTTIAIASLKGGVGKTTTAIHLAAYFQTLAPTLLCDGDTTRSSLRWAKQGLLPFKVVDYLAVVSHVKQHTHVIIDTQGGLAQDELNTLADGCDLLVIPTTPDLLSLSPCIETANQISKSAKYKILLTRCASISKRKTLDARTVLNDLGLPLFKSEIRDLMVFKDAALEGQSVKDFKNSTSNAAWLCYEKVGKEISQELKL